MNTNTRHMTLNIWQIDPANLTPYYNLALCDALANKGHRVTYMTTPYIYSDQLPIKPHYQVDYHYFRGLNRRGLVQTPLLRKVLRGVSYPLDQWRMSRRVKQEKPDIVHLQWSRLPRIDLPFIRAIKAQGIPIIHTIHNVRSSFATDDDIRFLGKVYAEVDLIMLHTQANQYEFLTQYPHIPPEKTIIIPLIDASNTTIPTGVTSDRAEFGLADHQHVFLFFGIIRPYKGLDLLIDAFTQMHTQCPDARLLIVGKATTPELAQMVNDAGQHPAIITMEGFIPDEDVWRYFAIADVAVFPYRTITQSAALIQAMGFGLPIIATDVGGLPETIDGNGWVVPANDVHMLAQTLREVVKIAPNILSQKGVRSAEIVTTQHSAGAIADRLLTQYHRLLAP